MKNNISSRINNEDVTNFNKESSINTFLSGKISKLRKAIAVSALLVAGVLSAPTKALAEGPQLELESGFMVGIPPRANCPNPFQYRDGRLKMVEGVKFDSHGHPVGEVDGVGCANIHSPVRLGASFIYSPTIGEEEFELDSEEEEAGHPMYRFKTQAFFLVVPDKLSIGPKIELALPTKDEEFQFGIGGSLEWQPERFHEIVPHGLVRLGSEGVTTWEAGLNYSAMLFNEMSLGAACLVEGHGEEVHGGCGPAIVFNIANTVSIAYDSAFGPGDEDSGGKPWQHHHITIGIGGHGH